MNSRDVQIVEHINRHYNELLEEMKAAPTLESFSHNLMVNKSVKMDLLQIGECVNHLSEEFISHLDKAEVKGITSVRNIVVHGYVQVDDAIIWNVVQEKLPHFIKSINEVK